MLEEISAKKDEQEKAFNLIVDDSADRENAIKVSKSTEFANLTPKANIKVVQAQKKVTPYKGMVLNVEDID